MTGVMHASFLFGLVGGILLASAVVFGSIYASVPTQSASGPLTAAAGQIKTTTATSTSSSTTAQSSAAASINGLLSTTTSTNSSGVSGANAAGPPNAYSFSSATSVLPSPRLGALLSQPGQLPVLLLPLIVALLFGFALYRVSARKD